MGRNLDNDIVLDDTRVSQHHARIEFDGTDYKIVDLNSTNGSFLANAPLLAGIPETWTEDKGLRLGSTWLRLVRAKPGGGPVAGAPLGASTGTRVDMSQIHKSSGPGRVGLYLDLTQVSVEPGKNISLPVVLLNQGELVDHFRITVTGVPNNWIASDTSAIALMPGSQQEVTLVIQPPRSPQSKAGRYPLVVTATSQDDSSQFAEAKITLTVTAYFQFASELFPQKIRTGQAGRITVRNLGNTQDQFRLAWKDRADEIDFKSNQAQVNVPEGKETIAEFKAYRRQRPLVGGQTSHPFTAQVAPSKGDPQTLSGEVTSRAWIPVWVLPIVFLLCLALAGGTALAYPAIFPAPTATAGPEPTSEPGAPVFDLWCIYPSNEPSAMWSTCPTQVMVTKGQKVTIKWQVSNAESVKLAPLGDRPSKGQEDYLPLENTVFSLQAFYQGKPGKVPVEGTIQVIVEAPPATITLTPTPTLVPTETMTPTPTVDVQATIQEGLAINAKTAAAEDANKAATADSINKTAPFGIDRKTFLDGRLNIHRGRRCHRLRWDQGRGWRQGNRGRWGLNNHLDRPAQRQFIGLSQVESLQNKVCILHRQVFLLPLAGPVAEGRQFDALGITDLPLDRDLLPFNNNHLSRAGAPRRGRLRAKINAPYIQDRSAGFRSGRQGCRGRRASGGGRRWKYQWIGQSRAPRQRQAKQEYDR